MCANIKNCVVIAKTIGLTYPLIISVRFQRFILNLFTINKSPMEIKRNQRKPVLFKYLMAAPVCLGLVFVSFMAMAQNPPKPPPPPPSPGEVLNKINPFKKNKKDTKSAKDKSEKAAGTAQPSTPPPPPNPLKLIKKLKIKTPPPPPGQ